jgi:hypothetical protein
VRWLSAYSKAPEPNRSSVATIVLAHERRSGAMSARAMLEAVPMGDDYRSRAFRSHGRDVVEKYRYGACSNITVPSPPSAQMLTIARALLPMDESSLTA